MLIFDKDLRGKCFRCSSFHDQYIIQMNEKSDIS